MISLFQKARYNVLDCTVPEKVGAQKSIVSFHSLHGRKVNLYIKLSHSSLSKNIMCLA